MLLPRVPSFCPASVRIDEVEDGCGKEDSDGWKVVEVDSREVIFAAGGAYGNEPYAPLPGRNIGSCICAANVLSIVDSTAFAPLVRPDGRAVSARLWATAPESPRNTSTIIVMIVVVDRIFMVAWGAGRS